MNAYPIYAVQVAVPKVGWSICLSAVSEGRSTAKRYLKHMQRLFPKAKFRLVIYELREPKP